MFIIQISSNLLKTEPLLQELGPDYWLPHPKPFFRQTLNSGFYIF